MIILLCFRFSYIKFGDNYFEIMWWGCLVYEIVRIVFIRFLLINIGVIFKGLVDFDFFNKVLIR